MKEYDVYLKNRLTEGELILSSLPYRKMTGGKSAMILSALLDYFQLQKLISVSAETELDADLDEMIRILYAKIETAASVKADADMIVNYRVGAEGDALCVDAADVSAMTRRFFQVRDSMGITADPVKMGVKYHVGDASAELAMAAACDTMVRRMAACVSADAGLSAAVDATEKQDFLTVEHRAGITAEVDDLLYRYTVGAEQAFAIAAAVTGTEIKHPLGSGSSEIGISASDAETGIEKQLNIRQAIQLYIDWSDTLLKRIDGYAAAEMAANIVGTAIRRVRKLSEMDGDTLSVYDGMTLDDTDYITLEG